MAKAPPPPKTGRQARLAEELRRNLKKRKAQDRARSAGEPGNTPEAVSEASPSPEGPTGRTIPNGKA